MSRKLYAVYTVTKEQMYFKLSTIWETIFSSNLLSLFTPPGFLPTWSSLSLLLDSLLYFPPIVRNNGFWCVHPCDREFNLFF